MTRLAVFSTQPAPYHSPLWRELSKHKGLDSTVYYFNDQFVRGELDANFGVKVAWDVPMLDGYQNSFISRQADFDHPSSVALPDAEGFLRKGRFDAVLIHGYTFAYQRQVLKAARSLGLGVLMRGEFSMLNPTEWWKRPLKARYLRWFYSKVHAFAVIGENSRQHLAAHGVGEDRMAYSPYGVDTKHFERQKKLFSRAPARKQLGYGPREVVALFSGKLIDRKQPLVLLRALARLPKVHGLFVGDGPQMAECKRLIADAGMQDRIHLAGFVNQSKLGLYFQAADMFILPSWEETWGLVVNEAMQFGLPVIVSDRVGSRLDLVKSGRTGLVFPTGDDASLADAIGTLASGGARRRAMGRHAEALVASFDGATAAAGVVRALEIALSKSSATRQP